MLLTLHHRDAVAGQVERHDSHLLIEIGDKIIPHAHRLEVTVQQHDALLAHLRVAQMYGR